MFLGPPGVASGDQLGGRRRRERAEDFPGESARASLKLVVDEIGYLSVTPNGARLFFHPVRARLDGADLEQGLRALGRSCTTR